MKLRLIILLLTILLLSSCTFDFGYINRTDSEITNDITTTEPFDITTESSTESHTSESISTPLTTEPHTTPIITTSPDTEITVTTEIQTTLPETTILDLDLISAETAFVYNVTAGEVISIKGNVQKIIPASITKLLTIQYALSIAPYDLEITPKAEELSMVGTGSSIAYIKTHHRLTVAQLVKGMMLPSGNDAAYALAAGVGRYISGNPNMNGSDAVQLFVQGMNEYAKSLGCTDTVFTVPDGLAGEEHYTSVNDLIIIGKNALKCDLITEYSKIVSEKVKYASGHTITWNNTNRLINPEDNYYSPYVTGLKTGSLTDNYCLYISAEINGSTYLIGIFKSPTKNLRYDDAHKIIDSILELCS